MTDYKFAPCPFCGAGRTELHETRLPPRMDGRRPALISAEVRHGCRQIEGVITATFRVTGRTIEDAVNAWNRRAS